MTEQGPYGEPFDLLLGSPLYLSWWRGTTILEGRINAWGIDSVPHQSSHLLRPQTRTSAYVPRHSNKTPVAVP